MGIVVFGPRLMFTGFPLIFRSRIVVPALERVYVLPCLVVLDTALMASAVTTPLSRFTAPMVAVVLALVDVALSVLLAVVVPAPTVSIPGRLTPARLLVRVTPLLPPHGRLTAADAPDWMTSPT